MAELITTSALKISVKPADIAKLQALPTYDATKVTDKGTGKDAVKELALTVAKSPAKGKYWRLVYKAKSKEALMLFESEGEVRTPWSMYCGTKEECLAEITKQALDTKLISADKLKPEEEKPKEEPIDIGVGGKVK